jgi:hypothetical protein
MEGRKITDEKTVRMRRGVGRNRFSIGAISNANLHSVEEWRKKGKGNAIEGA